VLQKASIVLLYPAETHFQFCLPYRNAMEIRRHETCMKDLQRLGGVKM
jgi:hypothetical protein